MEPLVPPEVDLRDFPSMPVIRARLFGSTFHSRANDSEWRAGVTLWIKSWDQVPAGTLPDDDIDLCRLAELGRDVKEWKKLQVMAMRGWEVATDGLLYHRVVAECVLVAWLEKLGNRLSGGAGNAKRWGFAFDPDVIQKQIVMATGMLFTLNPESKALRKKRGSGIPTGPPNRPNGSADGIPNGNTDATQFHRSGIPDGSPGRIASEVKRSTNRLNRDVERTPNEERAVDNSAASQPTDKTELPKVKIAIDNTTSQHQSTAGQNWNNRNYVYESGKTFGRLQRQGESYSDYRDAVITESQRRMITAGAH